MGWAIQSSPSQTGRTFVSGFRVLTTEGEGPFKSLGTDDALEARLCVIAQAANRSQGLALAPGSQWTETAFPTQRLLGTMQWTPLRMSTTWLTRQSTASAVSE
jgi:hypothetical protein